MGLVFAGPATAVRLSLTTFDVATFWIPTSNPRGKEESNDLVPMFLRLMPTLLKPAPLSPPDWLNEIAMLTPVRSGRLDW